MVTQIQPVLQHEKVKFLFLEYLMAVHCCNDADLCNSVNPELKHIIPKKTVVESKDGEIMMWPHAIFTWWTDHRPSFPDKRSFIYLSLFYCVIPPHYHNLWNTILPSKSWLPNLFVLFQNNRTEEWVVPLNRI